MAKKIAAAILLCAVMVLVAAAPLAFADTHHVVKGAQGPRASAVTWSFVPPDYGTWYGHIVNNGLRSLVVDVYDVTMGVPEEVTHQRIRFAAYGAFPTGIVDTATANMSPGHSYSITVTPNGPKGTFCDVEDMYVIAYPPVALINLVSINYLEVAVDGSASYDPAGQPLTYAWTFGDGGTATGVAATHTYASDGSYLITLRVTDTDGMYDEDTLLVSVAAKPNTPPVLDPIGDKTVDEMTLLTFTATASDSDIPAQTLSFSLIGAPAGASITAGGVFTWTPSEAQGPGDYMFDVVVSDGSLTASETITVHVNEVNLAPVLDPIGSKTVDEGNLLTFTATATDADIPVQVLTFSLSGAVPAGASITSDGVFTWTPIAAGDYAFDVVVSDGSLTDSETITVRVNELNVAPVLDPIGDKTVDEMTLLAFTATATDANIPAQTLTFSLSGAPAGASMTSSGVFTWTPSEAQGPGDYTFDVVVSDGSLTDSETITVHVNEVNVAPVLDPIGGKTVTVESLLTFTATATDADIPAQTLAFSLIGAPAGASITAGGVFSWTPSALGDYTFDVVVSDGSLSDSETITVSVVATPNTAPVLDPIGGKTVDEGNLLTFTATATDSDIPAQILTFSLGGAVPAGASITSGGVFSWTPSEAQGPGDYAFDVIVSDGSLTDSETITVHVNEVNVAPVLDPIGNKNVDEGNLLTFTATATDSDIPVQTLAFSLIGAPAGASITAGGAFAWTPSEAQGPGDYAFDVVVSDGSLTDSETITVHVNEVNVAPVLNPIGGKTVTIESLLTFTATASDADIPVQTLAFSLIGAPAGASITAGGVFTWTPSALGDYTFDVVVSDGSLSDSETITVSVVATPNTAPVLGLIGNKNVDEGSLLTFTATATDADIPAQTLTFSLSGAPAGASMTSAGVFTWTPSEAQGPGDYTFDVVVSDGSLTDSETITVHVNEVNVAPVLGLIGNKNVAEGSLLTFTATATDADIPAQTLAFSLSGAVPAGASITAGGAFSWTPSEAQGPGDYTFDVVVSDGSLTDSETITVHVSEVNVAPVLAPIGNKNVNEGSLLTFTATASDADVPVQTLAFSLSGVVPAGASITAGGVFTWTPGEAQGPGDYTFDVVVSDGSLTDSETITVHVNEVNVAPVLGAVGNKNVNEGSLLTFTATATDADIPVQTLAFSLIGAPAGASITAGGVFTWTPSEAQGPGDYTFDVVVSDGSLSDSETITVHVNEVNVAPVLGAIGNKNVNEGSLLTFTATASDADVPVQTLAFSLGGVVPAGASITAGGVFSWTPSEAQGPGDYTFDVIVSDGSLTDSETITVHVNEVNVAPVLGAIGGKTVNEGSPLTFTATATDADIPVQTLAFSLSGAVPAGASMTSAGVFTWTPSEAQGPGDYTFDVIVSDGSLTDSETITVHVNEVNVAPVLGAIGSKTVDEMTLLTFAATATDADIPVQTLAFSLSGIVPAGASITAGGVFTWTPSEAQGPGDYTFDVVVSDGSLTDSETITVSVSEVNVAPVLAAIGGKTVNEGSLLTFTATATDADIPAQTLAFSLVGAPAGASMTAGGVFTWTPSEAQGPGDYTFDVVVSDGALTDSETITVSVSEVNVAPVLGLIGNKNVAEGSLLTFTATATDADIPVQTLTFSLGGAVPAGASITAGGVFSWTPSEAQGPGDYAFDVVVSDGSLTDSETITVSVSEVNVAPVLGAIGSKIVDEMTLLTFAATATDADIPAQTLAFSLVGAPAGAGITAGGVFTWTPSEAQGPGDYTFDVVVSDGTLTDSETITVHVNEVNVAPVLGAIGGKTVDKGTLLAFTATATDADIPAQTLTFSLGGAVPAGASISAAGVFSWTPSTAGDYTFDVVVSDGSLTDSETIIVHVSEVGGPPPVASFLALKSYLMVSVDASASTGAIVTYAWDFGDGTTATGVAPWPAIAVHTYLTAGTKTITLTVTDNIGQTNVTTKSIAVAARPGPPPPPLTLEGYTENSDLVLIVSNVLITNLRTGGHMMTNSAPETNPDYNWPGYYGVNLDDMPGGYALGDVIEVKAVSLDGTLAGTATVTLDGSITYWLEVVIGSTGLASLPGDIALAATAEQALTLRM